MVLRLSVVIALVEVVVLSAQVHARYVLLVYFFFFKIGIVGYYSTATNVTAGAISLSAILNTFDSGTATNTIPAAAYLCTPCPISYFTNSPGQSSCLPCFGVYPNNTGSSSCAYPLSAKFSDSADSIIITLSASISSSYIGTNCSSSIPDSTIVDIFCYELICNAPLSLSCIYTSISSATIFLPPTALIYPLDNLTLYSSIYDKNLPGTLVVEVSPQNSPTTPNVYLFGPQNVGSCDSATIDASSSSGSGGRSFKLVVWNVFAATTTNSFSSLLSFLASSTSLYISIPSNYIPNNSTFTISLTLTNWLGYSSTGYIRFSKSSSSSYFPIFLSSPIYQKIHRYSSVSYSASSLYAFDSTLSSCYNVTDVAYLTYSFQWTQYVSPQWNSDFEAILLNDPMASSTPATDILILDSLNKLSNTLYIPAFTLNIGKTYGIIFNSSYN